MTPGRLMWRRLPSFPSVRTSHSTLLPLLGEDFHLENAVVHEHGVAFVDIVDELAVIDINRVNLLALRAAHGESELFAGLEMERDGQVAGADSGALGVHENADAPIPRGGGGADVMHDAARPIVRRVRHVEAENIQARVDEPPDHIW